MRRWSHWPIAAATLCLAAPLWTGPGAPTAYGQEPGDSETTSSTHLGDNEELPDGEVPDEDQVPDDERLNIYDRVEVRERADDLVGITQSASEGVVGAIDLERRPIQRPGELVETVPGVIATQHSGGGKANQYFLRGFNLDHGTDFSVSVAGVPVNMPSHGHGQGYADLSFLIPELVDSAAYRKGPYHADSGDFSAAGTVDMRLRRALDDGFVEVTGGSFDFGRIVAADSFRAGDGDVLAALELSSYAGPWTRPDDYEKVNGILSYAQGDASRGFSVTAMGYDGDWLSTDQIPRREVEAGSLGRFDLIDPGPRGSTERYQLSAELHRGGDRSLTSVTGYLLSYDFRLVSNFTYLLEDPELGDQFEQVDERLVAGVEARREWLGSWLGHRVESRVGLDLRWDDIDNGLFRTSDLERVDTVRTDAIDQLGGGLWGDTTIQWSPVFRTTLGLRADYYDADVVSDLAANSGTADDLIVSPKLALVAGPFGATELFVNFGWGYHSNDARGATIRVDPVTGDAAAPVEPLVRARGAEVGMRTSHAGWTTSLALFGLELDSELVFVGDGGATEASRPSRRMGLEWTNLWRASRWLHLDADLTLTDAEFTDADPAGDEIPGAIGTTFSAGVELTGLGPFTGGLRWRYFGDIPLIEDGSAVWGSSSVVNATATYHLGNGVDVSLQVFNLFDREDSDIQYFYASRLAGEPAEGIEDVHFHPLERRSGRVIVAWRF